MWIFKRKPNKKKEALALAERTTQHMLDVAESIRNMLPERRKEPMPVEQDRRNEIYNYHQKLA